MQNRTLRWCSAGAVAGLVLLSLPVGAARWRRPDVRTPESQRVSNVAAPEDSVVIVGDKGAPLTKIYYPPVLPAGTDPVLQPVAPDKRTESGRPQAAASVPKPGAVYIAQKGDTLLGVARKLGVNARALAHLNDFTTLRKKFAPGQTLRLPASAKRSRPTHDDFGQPGLVQSALRFWGVPYRWAGTSVRGMDCSGLVKRVLETQGVDAPHNAAQLYKLGIPVDSGDLQSGDLVFFANTYRPGVSHVGIYIGNGQFIHASSGRGVTISSLSEPYFQKHYAGARRVE